MLSFLARSYEIRDKPRTNVVQIQVPHKEDGVRAVTYLLLVRILSLV